LEFLKNSDFFVFQMSISICTFGRTKRDVCYTIIWELAIKNI